jgi:hypothetical protein
VELIISSPFVIWAVIIVAVGIGVVGIAKGDYRQAAASLVAPGVLLFLLLVQRQSLEARLTLLRHVEYQRAQAESLLVTAQGIVEGSGKPGVGPALDLMAVSQAADAAANQAVVAEAEMRVASSIALLTTLLVFVTLYAGWQSRAASLELRQQLQAAAQQRGHPEIVLVLPRRFARVRRWLRPTSTAVEERKL